MHLLYDIEIKHLAIKAEEFILHQRSMLSILNSHERYKSLIVEETPEAIALYLLKDSHYLAGDIERLTKAVRNSMDTMEWYANNC